MSERSPNRDEGHVAIIGHIRLRDPDTGEVILSQRDKPCEKATND